MVQWLRVCTSRAGGMGSILGQETKIPHAMWQKKKNKNKPKVSEKDSNWLSSGHILLANGPENTAHELVQLEFMSPCLFFLQREKARIL